MPYAARSWGSATQAREVTVKVCVDPGHGMSNRSPGVFDPGATHTESGILFRESDIVLKYGLTLKDVLRARAVEVFMTRDDDTDPAPVTGRAKSAKVAGCDKFVSIHVNAAEVEQAKGLEVLYNDETVQANKALAEKLQKALIKVTKLKDRGVKLRTDLAVLKFKGPAVLIELGFIANDGDRATFMDPLIREQVCIAVADALKP
jgi:N-acetylmuramoyl-L-alanine amidase